jgi:hypothetical protein
MKQLIAPIIFVCILFYQFSCKQDKPKLKTGDILFISSGSGQGKAIQLATKSKYTHVGLVFVENGTPYVYHAVEPVMKSTLDEFLNYSADGKYTIKRLKNVALLGKEKDEAMRKMGASLLGKHYDIYFNWKDNEWYCSEYVWKLYQRVYNIELGKLRPLKDFDLSSAEVQYIMQKRYGKNIPYEEKMISPQDMFDSELLETIEQ